MIIRHHAQVDSCSIPEEQWQKEILSVVTHFAWKEKWSEVCVYTDSWVATNGLAWSGTWKENRWKISDNIWGRDMWMNLSEWVKNTKTLVSYVNAH